jgi:glutathione S-transferase
VLAESNAILCWLGDGTPLVPPDAWQRAQMLQWLFFEQYSHEPYIAVARFISLWLPAGHERRAELPRLRERGAMALAVMEKHLQGREFFVDGGYSLADIALFAYTHVASDGGFDLEVYPAVSAWIERVKATPRFVPMAGVDSG